MIAFVSNQIEILFAYFTFCFTASLSFEWFSMVLTGLVVLSVSALIILIKVKGDLPFVACLFQQEVSCLN